MGRKASVRYWASRGSWVDASGEARTGAYCCEHQGKQHILSAGPDDAPAGPNYNNACKRFGELVAGKAPGSSGPTLGEVAAKYLEWASHNREPETVRIRTQRLAALCREFGHRGANSLTAYELEAYCDRQRPTWNSSTISLTLASVKACLRWAADKGVIDKTPLGKLTVGTADSRGLECVLTAEQEVAVINAAKPSLRDLAQVLRDTGARPGEISQAEATNYDANLGALVYAPQHHKTGKKTKRSRVIYLSGESRQIVERLVKLHPTGPIFRSPRVKAKGPHKGQRWSWTAFGIAEAFIRLRKKTGIKGLIAYSFRHTYAVRWLRAGKPIAPLAEVLGTSIRMIVLHYGHLTDQHDYLRSLVGD